MRRAAENPVIAGMMAEYCVKNYGAHGREFGISCFRSNRCNRRLGARELRWQSAWRRRVYRVVMTALHNEFGQVVTTDAVLAATHRTAEVAFLHLAIGIPLRNDLGHHPQVRRYLQLK